MRRALFLVLTLGCAPLVAQAFTAQNGMTVEQTNATDLAVRYHGRADDTDYWCAAGDYAVRALRLGNKTRIYRATAQPRKAGQGILFTLDPARKADGAGISSFGSGPNDGSLSIGQAVGSYCRTYIWRPFD